MSRFFVFGAFLASVLSSVSLAQQPSTNTSADKPTVPAIPDPAAVKFTTDTGVLMVAVKPDKVADYEAAVALLQKVLSETKDDRKRELARGWRVFKAVDVDAKSNAIYFHLIYPAVADADYRPSLLLDELIEDAPGEVLAKYRDSIAAGPNRLSFVEFAHMATPPKPANASPSGPTAPGKPGNSSPDGPQSKR